jgi:hypothetical protein
MKAHLQSLFILGNFFIVREVKVRSAIAISFVVSKMTYEKPG